MKRFKRIAALALTAAMLLSLSAFASEPQLLISPAPAQENAWLVPKLRESGGFTDTAGTIAADAAATCCQAGLMEGVDSRHFSPATGLTHSQIIVISARLLDRLTGGDLTYFESVSLTGSAWWTPYDAYLAERLPALADADWYQAMTATVTDPCLREEFFRLLATVLDATDTALPERNDVSVVPDCQDPDLLQFYRWGALTGHDRYGTLRGYAPLTRAQAAAMLARLIAPAQRLTGTPEPLDLCQVLLGVSPDTALFYLEDEEIRAGLFLPVLVETAQDTGRFAAMMLEQSGLTLEEFAANRFATLVLCETLAYELGVDAARSDTLYLAGYHGFTAEGQAWYAHHTRLLTGVQAALEGDPFPEERVPEVDFGSLWDTLDFVAAVAQIRLHPEWFGTY